MPLKAIFTLPPPYIFPLKCDVVYSKVITNDVICPPLVTTSFKRSGEAKIDIALVHLCDLRHGVIALLDRRLCDKNVFLIQIDALSFAEFEISEFEISRFDCSDS